MSDECDTGNLAEAGSPEFHQVHAAILARALAGPPPEDVMHSRLERIKNRLAQFSSILHQDAALDEHLRGLIIESFHPPTTSPAIYQRTRPPLTPISFPMQLIDELASIPGLKQPTDRQALRDDLQLALFCFRFDSLVTSTSASTKRAKVLEQLRLNLKHAQRALLNAGMLGIHWHNYDAVQNQMKFRFETEREGLRLLEEAAKRALDQTPSRPSYRLRRPPIVTLIGINLPWIFEAHFGVRPGRGRSGTFMQFATNVLAEMGLNYRPNTIQAYLVAAKMNRTRRKLRGG